ncbi:MAG: NfeD family protein [Lachnospiraceae bacterium]|nr:NfeD family protein [Lachnospiraceae bacterium]
MDFISVNKPIIWLIILVVLLLIEILTLGLTTIWFAGGAVAAFITALLGAGLPVQIIVFLVVSVLLLLFTRPLAVRYLNRKTTATNVDSLIGADAVVTEEIHNLLGKGQITIHGAAWTARASREGDIIPRDTVVRVVKIDGVKAIVEKVNTSTEK